MNSALVLGWGGQCWCLLGDQYFASGWYLWCAGRASLYSLEDRDQKCLDNALKHMVELLGTVLCRARCWAGDP